MTIKKIIIILSTVFTIFVVSLTIIYIVKYHKFSIDPVVFKDKYLLKNELNNTHSSRYNYHCLWRYGHDKEYHDFMLICKPWEKGNTTYDIAEKKYKIKRNLLKVDNTYLLYGERTFDKNKDLDARSGPPVNALTIHW